MSLDRTRIKGLCFDVDGTLADTDDQFVNTLANWLRPLNRLPEGMQKRLSGKWNRPHQKTSLNLARRIVMGMESPANLLYGLPDRWHLDKPLLAISEWLWEITHQTKGNVSNPNSFQIMDGVQEMLAVLQHQFPLSVVSARGERGTRYFLEKFNLSGYFRCVATAQTCQHTKPYPDPILWAAEKMNIEPEECLMIGDTTVDILAGRGAGAQTVGVLCGFGTADELLDCGADEIIDHTTDLLKILNI